MDSDVQFEEEDLLLLPRPSSKKHHTVGIVTRITISLGLAKDTEEAQKVLAIIAAVLIFGAAGYYIIGNISLHNQPATPAEVQASLYPNGSH